MRVATITTCTTRSCAPYIGALLTSVPASVSLSSLSTKLCPFSPLRLCTSARLHLCAFAPLFCSPHCAVLVSALLSSLICSCLCSALVSVLLFSLLWSSRSLLCIRLYSSLRLCICVCFRLGLTRRVALYIGAVAVEPARQPSLSPTPTKRHCKSATQQFVC